MIIDVMDNDGPNFVDVERIAQRRIVVRGHGKDSSDVFGPTIGYIYVYSTSTGMPMSLLLGHCALPMS